VVPKEYLATKNNAEVEMKVLQHLLSVLHVKVNGNIVDKYSG
jgi:hypothetical protein